MKSILFIVLLLAVLALTVVGHETPVRRHGLIGRSSKKTRFHRIARQFGGQGKGFNPQGQGQGKGFNPQGQGQGKGFNPQGQGQGKGKGAPPAGNPPAGTPPPAAAPPSNSDADFNQNSLSGNANPDVCQVSGLTKGDGTQLKGGSCVSTQIGEVPSVDKMISTLITSPSNGATIKANTAFTITALSSNIEFGNFDNPDTEYYAFSQQLNKQGLIKGHTHVTLQQLGGGIPDPQKFAFFKGLNDKSQNGALSVSVPNGVPAGQYRLCTMTASFAHTPVIMPVAQRGAQDDCIRINVQ